MNRDEAHRAREAARERHKAAEREVDSWARVIAEEAVRGFLPPTGTGDQLVVARAAALEARADWMEARERCGLRRAS